MNKPKTPQLPREIVEKIKSIFTEQQTLSLKELATKLQEVLPNFNQAVYTQYGFEAKFSDFINQLDFLEIKGEKPNLIISLKQESKKENKSSKIKLNDTDIFASKEQHENIKQYLNSKNISVSFKYNAVDTSGYFDEAAELIAKNFDLLNPYIKQLRYLYSNDRHSLIVNCQKLSDNEINKLQNIFKTLFNYTFITKCFYKKEENKFIVSLNQAEPIKKFFMGEWLEWFVIIKLLKTYHQDKKFSIARSVVIQNQGGDKHEFDVVFRLENQVPLFIECKSGDFRKYLDKFIKICKKIDIPLKNWLVLGTEIDESQCEAFEKMYSCRFCNLSNFSEKVNLMISSNEIFFQIEDEPNIKNTSDNNSDKKSFWKKMFK